MKRRQSITSFVAAALLMLAVTSLSEARDFSQTCTKLSLQGTFLTAVCWTSQKCDPARDLSCYCDSNASNCRIGRTTSIDLNQGISNVKGTLKFHGANFIDSCKDLYLETTSFSDGSGGGSKTGVLDAKCKGGMSFPFTSGYGPTSLNLNEGISNNQGSLVFDR
ncbi:hypothetical protein FY034_03110 [Trichlorobacter lovleyi]|uniref:CVNH domain-containing protein n=1 Tax=Trichlorobacter lovleyi TaxID=313985 RepID=UPI0022407E5F|nr:CVNH domain-containing protein [Trichlorobacter lovleyi]QOX77971.1 hypothetical protein FY034_03110 [Trichlorobacter lovleyi]